MFDKFILRIKRKETPFYAFLYRLAKSMNSFSLPCVRPIHLPLYYFDYFVKISARKLINMVWSVPIFRARCERVGKGLSLPNGIPLIQGSHLKLYLGDNVTIGRSTIGAGKIFDEPILRIGNNSTIGYGTVISVSKEVDIGNDCMIAAMCLIMDSDDHPLSPQKRLQKMPVKKEEIKEIKIGNNVWIGSYAAILKGVTIGDNAIIATHSVVTKDVLPNCVYAGFPARPTLRDLDKIDS